MLYEHSYFYKSNSDHKKLGLSLDEQLRNNADSNPDFYFYVTNEINMRLLLSGLIGKDLRKTSSVFTSPSTASSNFIMEISTKGDGKYWVEAYYND